jgi:pSer/pThr/pTyr-binding forkhead associated (FHA) protein
MSDWSPCPACGTENGAESSVCRICGYRLDVAGGDSHKCARCGAGLGAGFEFCQTCGLRVHSRRPRPVTSSLKLVQRGRDAEPVVGDIGDIGAAAGLPAADAPPAPIPARMPEPLPAAVAAAPAPVAAPLQPAGQIAFSPEPEPAVWSPPQAPSQAPGPVVASGPAPAPRRSAGQNHLRLVLVQRDGSEGEVVPLGDAPLTIGRLQADLRFPGDEFLESTHARIDPVAGGVRVVDLGTHNGVYLRISRPESVFPGDLFLLGHHLLRLENVPEAGREQEPTLHGVKRFGTPLLPAWGRLVLIGAGGAEAESHYLRHPQVVFGRELGDIVFPADPFVSWQHAQLAAEVRADGMGVTLTDLRSANGTYLRTRGDVILQPGDMFRVGDQIFRVRMH